MQGTKILSHKKRRQNQTDLTIESNLDKGALAQFKLNKNPRPHLKMGHQRMEPYILKVLEVKGPAHTSIDYFGEDFDEEPFDDEKMKLVTRNMEKFTYLKRLIFSFECCDEMSGRGFMYLSDTLRNFSSLRILDISIFDRCDYFVIGPLGKGLKHLTSLQSFKFKTFSIQLTDEQARLLTQSFKYLTSLRNLSLSIFSCPLSGEGLVENLRYVRSLDTLNLEFHSCYDVEDESIIILNENLKFLTHLQHLKILYRECQQITGCPPMDGLKSLTSLKTFSWNFSKCTQVTDKGMAPLGEALKYLTSLQDLRLEFREMPQITSELVAFFCRKLLNMKKLTNLRLDFCEINDEGIINLSEQLRHLVLLENLYLRSQSYDKISNEGLRSFGDSLRNLVLLRTLDIEFGWCDENLHEALKNLTALQTLKVVLSKFKSQNVTDQKITSLSQALRHVVSLRDLIVSFSSCPNITDEGVISIFESLPYLENLQSLHFTGCELMTDEAIKSLTKELKRMTSLNSLSLFLRNNCPKISNNSDTMKLFIEEVKSLPLLQGGNRVRLS